MSSKKQKAKPKAEKVVLSKPEGKVPVAMVESRHLGGMITRAGRGFSMAELSGAKVPMIHARKWGLPTDPLRSTALEGNVKALGKWYTPVAKAAKAPPKVEEAAEPEEKPAKKKATRKKKAEA